MRTVMLTYGQPSQRTVPPIKGQSGGEIGMGVPLNARGDSVGCDLYCEVEPGKWVHANALPEGMFAEAKNRGTLYDGLLYNGKVYSELNVKDTNDRLIASLNNIPMPDETRARATMIAQRNNPGKTQQLTREQLQHITQLLSEINLSIQNTAKSLHETQPATQLANVHKDAPKPKKGHTPPTEPESNPFEHIKDLKRVFTGESVTKEESEDASIHASWWRAGLVPEEGTFLDSKKMNALRKLSD